MSKKSDASWLRTLAKAFSERQHMPGGCIRIGPSHTPGGCLKGKVNGKSPGRCYKKRDDWGVDFFDE